MEAIASNRSIDRVLPARLLRLPAADQNVLGPPDRAWSSGVPGGPQHEIKACQVPGSPFCDPAFKVC
jgi:hypothetical protein